MKKFKPLHDRVVVEPLDAEVKTSGIVVRYARETAIDPLDNGSHVRHTREEQKAIAIVGRRCKQKGLGANHIAQDPFTHPPILFQ